MSAPSSSSHDPFQQFLASAYAVQQSGMDTQSLATLLELQQALAASPADQEDALALIADRAQNIAGATGVAIASLVGDQLVFRAGSGCAASSVGRHMSAVLSVSSSDLPRSEILRVEDANTDGRIVADICRQFESQALLILPVYRDHAVAGVFQVLFSEPHVFQDSELRAYRMMIAMAEDAIFRPSSHRTQPSSVPHAIGEITAQFDDDDVFAESPIISYPMGGERWLPRVPMNTAVTGMIAALVLVAGWIIYEHRPTAPSSTWQAEASTQTTNTASQKLEIPPVKPTPASQPVRARNSSHTADLSDAPNSSFRKVWVGPNEVDYVSKDVTIRRFVTTKPQPTQARNEYREVRIGKDVTMRYFASKPPLGVPAHPVSNAAQAVEQAVPTAK